jgi:hypothetical protein
MAPKSETTADRAESARAIVKLFSLERYCYLALSLVTAAFILYVGYQAIESPTGDRVATACALCGSGGVVTYNIGRLLNMFNRVIDAVFPKRMLTRTSRKTAPPMSEKIRSALWLVGRDSRRG